MPPKDDEIHPPLAGQGTFHTTHWSVVLAARDGKDSDAQVALNNLCRTYWSPVYTYVRRAGFSPADAQDITQAFFAQFLEKEYLKRLRHQQGRFRSFLLLFVKANKPRFEIELYDTEQLVFLESFPGRAPLRFSSAGTRLAMGSFEPGDPSIVIRELASAAQWPDLPSNPPRRRIYISALAFSPDGETLAAAGPTRDGDRELVLLEADTGRLLKVLQLEGTQPPIGAMQFTPDGAFLITGGFFPMIQVWDVARGELACELEGHSAHIRSLAISPDGKTLATGDETGVLKLWSVEQRVELLTLRAHERGINCLRFSRDGAIWPLAARKG